MVGTDTGFHHVERQCKGSTRKARRKATNMLMFPKFFTKLASESSYTGSVKGFHASVPSHTTIRGEIIQNQKDIEDLLTIPKGFFLNPIILKGFSSCKDPVISNDLVPIINPPSTWCRLGLRSWSFAMGCRPWIISIGPWVDRLVRLVRVVRVDEIRSSWACCRSTWSFPDGFFSTRWTGDVVPGEMCKVYNWEVSIGNSFFQQCNLQDTRCKQSSCPTLPTAAEPVEAEWLSPYRSWCKPVRTCSGTRSFPTSVGKYKSNIAQNSSYHST